MEGDSAAFRLAGFFHHQREGFVKDALPVFFHRNKLNDTGMKEVKDETEKPTTSV